MYYVCYNLLILQLAPVSPTVLPIFRGIVKFSAKKPMFETNCELSTRTAPFDQCLKSLQSECVPVCRRTYAYGFTYVWVDVYMFMPSVGGNQSAHMIMLK